MEGASLLVGKVVVADAGLAGPQRGSRQPAFRKGAPAHDQQPAASRDTVYEFLKSPAIDADLRLKILQSLDELERTVAIRSKFPN